MRRCYISKSYPNKSSGGNKAKTDVEQIMDELGFVNLGIGQSFDRNKVRGFILTLYSVLKGILNLKKGDILVLQYPLKKYYTLVCKIAHLKNVKIVTLIHDLGSFRRKKLSFSKERKRLANSDYLIALNNKMRNYLLSIHYKQDIGVLHMWDYLSETKPKTISGFSECMPEIIYVGALSHKRHSFMYKLDGRNLPKSYKYRIYGGGFDLEVINCKEKYLYDGFIESDTLILNQDGDYGLVWYGHSITEIDGVYGEYLQLTTTHKASLYIRCNIPLIVWSKCAQADFVRENNIGICIDSLEELDEILPSISEEDYMIMKKNTIAVSQKLESGYYFSQAYLEAEEILKKS